MKKKPKIEYIDKSTTKKCHRCQGFGIEKPTIGRLIQKWCGMKVEKCKICKGTGTFKDSFYYAIYTDKNGKKYCFGVDTPK